MKKSGMSLMVLVITIIVLIILATTVILSITNNDSVEKATEVVKSTDISKVQTLADLGLDEILKENSGNLVNVDVEQKLQEYLEKKKVKVDDYKIVYNTTEKKVTISQAEYIPIYTEGDLAKVANGEEEVLSDGNVYDMLDTESYKLMNDITISSDFTPINRLNGKLYGNNKRIILNASILPKDIVVNGTNLHKAVALILIVGENASIKNLGISGNLSVTGIDGTDSLVSTIAAINIGKIDSCYNEANIVISDFAGNDETGSPTGGLVGINANTIINSYNRGDITVNSGSAYVGGITGYNVNLIRSFYLEEGEFNPFGSLINGELSTNITNSYNVGNISINKLTNASKAGGISGQSAYSSIKSCFNRGNITASYDIGGITGTASSSSISNCYNVGEISNNKLGETFVAGIAGEIWENSEVFNSYNVGEIKKYEGSTENIEHIVGIANVENNSTMVKNCYYLQGTASGDSMRNRDVRSEYEK